MHGEVHVAAVEDVLEVLRAVPVPLDEDPGVHQNLAFAVHPDTWSGMHCWHQRVRIERPGPNDQYGDIFVDTKRSFENYKEWLAMTRPAPGPDGLRRPRRRNGRL